MGPGAPDIPITVGTVGVGLCREEGRVQVGPVVRDEVKEDTNAEGVRFFDEFFEVCMGAETWFDGAKVSGVITVMRGTGKERGEPEGVEPETMNVIQFVNDTSQGSAMKITNCFGGVPRPTVARIEPVKEDVIDDGTT